MTLQGDEQDLASFQGKTAVVTGAASGIGYSAAAKLAGLDAHVYMLDNHQERLVQASETLLSAGCSVSSITLDISDGAAVKAAFEAIGREAGKADMVISNAGIVGLLAPIEDMPDDEWDKMIAVNLKGAFLTVKHAIPLMKRDGGSISVTSSIHGNRVFNSYGMTAYSAAKAGLVSFAKSAALELAKYQIRVNVVCPGAIETRLNDGLRRSESLENVVIPVHYPEGKYPYGIGKPEHVADMLVFLASSKADYISGTEIFVDGARSLI